VRRRRGAALGYPTQSENGDPTAPLVLVTSLVEATRWGSVIVVEHPDAWYVPDSVKTGYEISFTRYFYKPKPLRTLEEIRAEILTLEQETEGLLEEIVGGDAR
jgi:hypothetical protein